MDDYIAVVRVQVGVLASRLRHRYDADDMFQDGMIGLLDALSKFDPSRGVRLRTYAEHRIRGAIWDGIRRTLWSRNRSYRFLSLDAFRLERPAGIEDPLSRMDRAERLADLTEKARRCLNPRERCVVGLVYIQERTIADVAEQMGLAYSTVHQTAARALVKLKRAYGVAPKYRMEPAQPDGRSDRN